MSTASPLRVPDRLALALGIVLVLPELVLAVVVVRQQIVVGLIGFAMTLGFIRLGLLAYRVLRERGRGRGLLFALGAVATVAGALLYSGVARAVVAAGDERFTGLIAPPATIWLNVVVVAVLGLWICGIVVAVGALAGAIRASRLR